MRIKILPGALVIAALVTLAISLGVATPNVYGGGDDSLPTLPEKPELKYPNLGSNLDQLVASVEEGETSAKEAAEDAPVHQEASVAVTIYLSGNLDDVVKFLEDNGGSPRNVGEDYIEAYVPVSLLGQVSERPGVIRVREIAPPQAAQIAQQVAGHGPPVHGSSAWNQAGFSGQGIKVGVIDSNFGFNDFSGLMGTELPSTVQARCYTSLGKFTRFLAGCENSILGSDHGTLLAEAVMDIAPEASLYIAAPWSLGDLRTATDWMVSQGVSVIVHGEIYEYDGPGDGTSPFSNSSLKTVDRAVSGGIVWVNAAGNQGQRAWFGDYSIVNVDGTKFVAFNGSDIFNDMTLEAWDWITVQLRWEDSWSAANRDFDLLIWDFATSTIVDHSFDPQQGRVGQVPFESLSYLVPNDGRYAVVVAHEGGSTPEWIQLTVWGVGSIEHYTGTGSIANPAESSNPGMLAVGAAHWNSVGSIDPYSSRGPTPDGRVKPDIVGADCGATALLSLNQNQNGFCGTSQSAAHVAGMAALVRQRFPGYMPVQVANYLKEHAEQRESPDPNNTWGHGFAKLPSLSECSDAVPSVASNPGLVADCEALLAARDTLAGSGTLNWSGSTAIAAWDGVTLSGSPLRVTSLVLSDSQLTGTIPPELGNLNNLERLSLTRNQLTGDIPPELSLLTNLQLLALGGNQLTGPIPTWLVNITNLEELYLWGNQFTGAIPPELGNLPGLVKLGLSENRLTGQIPPQLSSLTNLRYFSLFDNQLSGPVPTWMGSLADLEELYLSQNQLSGAIPTELGSLANLVQLQLSENQLTGEIPVELGSLANLERLRLQRNQLTGGIPAELGDLSNLKDLRLDNNQLTGEIPTELGSLTSLTVLSLGGNELTGEIPVELGSLASLERLSLTRNQLPGTIPTQLGNLTSLTVLALGGNQLTGPIPTSLGGLTNLEEVYLWGNELTGEIPVELGSLASLERLYLHNNQLTGGIPAELGTLTNLEVLSLRGNQLGGAIPTWLGSLTSLETLYLSENQLTGMIPAELGSLTDLRQLRLSENQLTGPIPTEMGSLANLEELFLSGNQLTGCIPAGIAGVANNDLNQLGLPFCAGAPGSPIISVITPGAGSLTVTWGTPSMASGATIIAYALRYIESVASDKSDANWTIVDSAWTTGSGALSYQISGLTSGTQYDVQVRAVVAAGDGPWSATAAVTPATWGAIRSFSTPSVSPGGQVMVTITANGFGAFGEVVETLPPGFNVVASSLPGGAVQADDREVSFILIGDTSLTYSVTAPSAAGSYSFSGVLTNSDGEEVPVGGALSMTVGSLPSVIVSRAAESEDAEVRPGSPISLTAIFSRPVSGFTVDDITVGNGAVGNFAGSGAVYTFDVTPNDIGEVTVDISAGAAEDTGGNGNTAAPRVSLGITYDDDGDGNISKAEAIAAIRDYFSGGITKTQAIAVIRLYFA